MVKVKNKHIIWDWNGTLLNDVELSLYCANQVFMSLGVNTLTIDEYRQCYSIPIKKFYSHVLGKEPTQSQWNQIGSTFNQYYKPAVKFAPLCDDAIAALQYWQSAHGSQSICSLMEHDELQQCVSMKEISHYFNLIDGRRHQLLKAGKSEQLGLHISQLGILPSECIVIGDAVDDALAAYQVGANAILYAGGTHSKTNLSKGGAYIVDSLVDASILANYIFS